MQVSGQQQEETQEDGDEEIPPGAHLQQLHAEKQQHQRHACFLPHQRAELCIHRAHHGQTGQHPYHPARQRPSGQQQSQPPAEQQRKAGRAPEGQVEGMGRHRQQRHRQQKQRVAPVAFPGAAQRATQRPQRGAQPALQGGVGVCRHGLGFLH